MKTARTKQAKTHKWFRARRRRHDPMLVLSMALFNSGSSWDRIFNPVPQHENVWGAHAPRVSFSAPSPKSVFQLTANHALT